MVTLMNGDFMECVKNIPDKSVDLVVTDPPYRCISGGKSHLKNQPYGILSKNDGKVFEYNNITPAEYFPEIYRILKDDTHFYVMTNTLNIEEFLSVGKETGFKLHNILIWKKNNATPNRWYMKNCEYILFFRKGKAKSINNKGTKQIIEIDNILGKKSHPTEKPVELMKVLIENSSKEGDLVVDPFMGTGSAGVASVALKRDFIGCEIDSKYFCIAEKRL